MKKTYCSRLRQFGYFFLCVSACLALMFTLGFDTASADRVTTIDVVEDENALLGVTDNTDGTTQILPGTEEPVLFVDDNLGSYDTSTTYDISATLMSFGTEDNPSLSAEVSVYTDDGYDWSVQLSCGPEDQNQTGVATVNIVMSGDVAVDLTRTTNEEVDANCSSE